MLAIAFVLVVLGAGDLPTLTTLAAYETEDACMSAATAVSAVLSGGEGAPKIVCLPVEALAALGAQARGGE